MHDELTQVDIDKMQAELEEKTYTAKAGGGAVEAVVSGKHSLISLTIAQDAVDPDDVEMLQDMVVAAANEALRKADAIFSGEIREAGLNKKLYKYFPIMVDAQKETSTIILRAVTISGAMLVPARLPYDLVERTVERILETTPTVRRVFYDQTPTPIGKETFQ